jgi:membrane associated rhomboid family serine protease/Zn-finger nucleic acid-binding protein
VCSSCDGIWFGPGQMADFIELMMINRPDLPDALPELHRRVVAPSQLPEPMRKCPGCQQAMHKVNYAYDSNIILDSCSACGGVWVDGTEIEQLVIHKRGSPRLDALGTVLLAHEKKMRKLRTMVGDTASEEYSAGIGGSLLDAVPFRIGLGCVLGVVLVNIMVYLHQELLIEDTSGFFRQYGVVPSTVLSWKRWFSLVSSMFVHGVLFQLLVNMFFLWLFGHYVEAALGHLRFAVFYLLAGLAGNVLDVALSAFSNQPVIGSGAAVAGVMGAFLALRPGGTARIVLGERVADIPSFVYVSAWVVLQVICALFFRAMNVEANVGFLGHVGGFLTGFALTRLWAKGDARVHREVV